MQSLFNFTTIESCFNRLIYVILFIFHSLHLYVILFCFRSFTLCFPLFPWMRVEFSTTSDAEMKISNLQMSTATFQPHHHHHHHHNHHRAHLPEEPHLPLNFGIKRSKKEAKLLQQKMDHLARINIHLQGKTLAVSQPTSLHFNSYSNSTYLYNATVLPFFSTTLRMYNTKTTQMWSKIINLDVSRVCKFIFLNKCIKL